MTPTIIEIKDGSVYSVYSNQDIKVFILSHDKPAADDHALEGPFLPTLVASSLEQFLPDDLRVDARLFEQIPDTPYFG